MYVCTYIHTSKHVYVRTYVRIHTHTHTHTHIYIHICAARARKHDSANFLHFLRNSGDSWGFEDVRTLCTKLRIGLALISRMERFASKPFDSLPPSPSCRFKAVQRRRLRFPRPGRGGLSNFFGNQAFFGLKRSMRRLKRRGRVKCISRDRVVSADRRVVLAQRRRGPPLPCRGTACMRRRGTACRQFRLLGICTSGNEMIMK